MKNRKNNKNIYLLVVLLLLLSMSIGYAYLTKVLKINNTASIAKTTWDVHFENAITREGSIGSTEPIISEDKKTVSLTVDLANPGDFYEYTVDIVNSGTIDAMIESIRLTELTEEEQKYIEYKVLYSDDIELNEHDELLAGAKDTIKVIVRYKDEIATEDIHLTIETTINYVQKDENAHKRKRKTLQNYMERIAIDDTDINYGAISSDTNGKGVYKLTKIETSTPIYYYRGEVDNNVIFGGFCWKIIRTTETGGTKLIYNGLPNNGVCDATGTAAEIDKSAYNVKQPEARYVGYMFDGNVHNSKIKEVVDTWFADNLLSYQDYLEDTPFYNERDYVLGERTSMYAAGKRIWGNDTSSGSLAANVPNTTIKLGAANLDDIFTVSSEIGNGALTYPVGLITSDEVVMAGGRGWISDGNIGENKNYYLCNGSAFWTMSPHSYTRDGGGGSQVIFVGGLGYLLMNGVTASYGVRPVISLAQEVGYLEGIGTKENPFIIAE